MAIAGDNNTVNAEAISCEHCTSHMSSEKFDCILVKKHMDNMTKPQIKIIADLVLFKHFGDIRFSKYK